MRRAVAALVLLALTAGVARAEAPPDLRRLFPLERDVTAPGGGLVRLPLPADVLAKTRPDLSDVRLFDAGEREVPFLIDTGARRGDQRELVRQLDATVLDAQLEQVARAGAPALYRETYELALPPDDAPAWDLVFVTDRPQFIRQLRVESIDADGNRSPLLADQALFRLVSPPATKLRVTLPSTTAPRPARLAVTLEGEDGGYLAPRLEFETTRDLAASATAEVALEATATETRDGRTVIELARPLGMVPDALRLETSTPAFARTVEVWDERPGQAAETLGTGSIVRLGGTTGGDVREVPLRAARGDRLRVEIADSDSPPLQDLRVVALVRQPALLFALPPSDGAPRSTLRYGGGRAHAPRYDLAALWPEPGAPLDPARAALIDGAAATAAELGPARDNPSYDGAPALSFAMRPGTTVDARAWTHQRPLAVADAPDGLTRIRLTPADLVPARPDLADVRIVDAQQRQWPYLLQADAARSWQALAVASPVAARGTSKYQLRLPVTPMTLDQVVLESDSAFIDRPFRLRGRTADGTEVPLAQGRLTLRGERPQPLAIGFAAQRLSGLELELDDGDEAALTWRAARARTIEPELFLVAPAGAYTLLLGNSDAVAPRYELERVRDVVFAVRGGDVAAEPLQPNPRYSAGARLASGDRLASLLPRLALWTVLLAAVIALGLVTLRTARR